MGKSAADRLKWPFLFLVIIGWMAAAPYARAIPAFAAQTGEPCSACHIGFPQLTPYGRLFKMEGYVAGGCKGGLLICTIRFRGSCQKFIERCIMMSLPMKKRRLKREPDAVVLTPIKYNW
jgi:hypothetical protein